MVSSAFLKTSKVNPYLYSGKEIDRMHGLNEYDFSARWQDAANPGFTTVDPLAEYYYDISPYAYCVNNPVNFTDPTGMGIHDDNQLGNVNCDGHDYSQGKRDGQNYANLYSSDHSDPNSGDPLMDGQYSYYQNGQQSQSSVPVNKDPELKDNRLEKLPAAVGMTADVMSQAGADIKLAVKISETAARHALTRPTTIIGAVLAGVPAAINMWNNGVNTNDLITVGISVAALALEFSPEGAVVNIGSAAVALGGVAWDAYTMTHP